MTNTADPAADHGARYRAALDMAAYADSHGMTAVSCEEHHLAATGWLPSPLVMAAAVAARTSRIRISVNALLIPLYDPVKLAEDIAVLDNLADGRFSFVAGMGYRPEEYEALGRDWGTRARQMDECLEVLLAAWSDGPFRYRGRMIEVTPKPTTKPHPLMFVGGMSAAAARRAARFGLPFSPPMPMPEIEAIYTESLAENGRQGFVMRPSAGNTITHLSVDPDGDWRRYGQYFRTEANEYSSWRRAGVPRPHEQYAATNEDLRRLGTVEILTAAELLAQCRAGRGEIAINPLMGGLPLEAGWESLRILGSEVLPALAR
nr:LLM class flavin-dependent oxidoreductase [Nocardia bovistercoris]